MQRTIAGFAMLVAAAGSMACGDIGPMSVGEMTLGGATTFALVAVDDRPLPCCARADSSGRVVTVVGGSLTLEPTAPEPYMVTPAGLFPISCVHEIPNGAHVDTSGVVTLPDSSTYRLPSCQELHSATYAMVITRRADHADGSSEAASETLTGTYAWTDGQGGTPAMLTLIAARMTGTIATTAIGTVLTVQRPNFGGPSTDPRYRFVGRGF